MIAHFQKAGNSEFTWIVENETTAPTPHLTALNKVPVKLSRNADLQMTAGNNYWKDLVYFI